MREDPSFQQASYDKYKVEMFMLCLQYANNRAEAEDFLQDGYLQVFRDLRQFDPVKGPLRGITPIYKDPLVKNYLYAWGGGAGLDFRLW